jgi:NAD(P)H-dependent FMN reductase
MITILSISGSLRKDSLNTHFLRAAAHLVEPNVEIIPFEGIGTFPLFNPDLEDSEPLSVLNFRKRIKEADAVIIASPEYAHGITGVMKNALDWVVGSGEFVNKPTCIINISCRAVLAFESLKEILKTMDAKIIHDASRVIAIPNNIDTEGILFDPQLSEQIRSTLKIFVNEIHLALEKNRSIHLTH